MIIGMGIAIVGYTETSVPTNIIVHGLGATSVTIDDGSEP